MERQNRDKIKKEKSGNRQGRKGKEERAKKVGKSYDFC